jgi:hypothetical protein
MRFHLISLRTFICLIIGILLFCTRSDDKTNQPALCTIQVRVLNENGTPVPVRVRFTSLDSTYWAPDGHTTDFSVAQVSDDVFMDNGRRFAYVPGEFTIALPPDRFVAEIAKGYAYRVFTDTVTVTQTTQTLEFQLDKWFEFPDTPWYSGDVHVHHIDPLRAALQTQAENLNVCNILTSDFTKDQEHFKGRPESNSDPNHLVYVNQEYRKNRLGHLNLLNLKTLVDPVKQQQPEHAPLLSRVCDETHRQNGHVTWAHFAQWPGLEGPLAILNGKVDAVELLCNVMPFHFAMKPFADVIPDFHNNSGLRIWYRLLNCGLRIPLSAGTDKMNNFVTVGGNRVFARVDGAFNYQSWIDAVNAGRTFVSNSPFLFLDVNGREPGDDYNIQRGQPVTVTAKVWSQFPLDRLEIIANGEMIAETVISHDSEYAEVEITVTPQTSMWFAARAYRYYHLQEEAGINFGQPRKQGNGATTLNRWYGTLRPETPFAHTSPVWCAVNNQAVRSAMDAEYFMQYMDSSMRWLERHGVFSSQTVKNAVLQQFRDGRTRFSELRN